MKRIKHFFTPSSQKISTIVVGVIMSMTIGTGFAAWNTVKGPGDSILSADWNALVTAVQSKLGVETDPKIGTPTTSYIPKWNGTSLADSALFESGNTKLIIKGATADNQAFGLNVVDSADASKFIVRNDGNVGIGTATPGAPLDVAGGGISAIFGADNVATTRTNAITKYTRLGSYHYTNAEEPAAIALMNSNATTNGLHFGGGTSLMNTATDIHFYTAANNTTLSGTERMVIDTSGNVGIGTASPGSLLHIGAATADATTNTLTIYGGITGNKTLDFKGKSVSNTGLDYTVGSIRVNQSGSGYGIAGSMQFFTAQNDGANNISLLERMRISDTGNVGIGTTGPANKLVVNVGAGATDGLYVYGTSGANPTVYLGHDAAHGFDATIQSNGVTGNLLITPRSGYNTSFTAGNVGIGTTSPASQLHLLKSDGYSGTVQVGGSTSAFGVKINMASDQTTGSIYSSPGVVSGTTHLLKLGVSSENTNQLVLKGDGNVGIGTTTPGAQLEISSAMDTDQLRMSYNGDLNYRNSIYNHFDGASAATSQMYFKVASGAGTQTEVMRLNGAGNVGIGTTAPGQKLDILGSTSNGTGLRVIGNTTGGYIADFRYPGTGAGGIVLSGYADGSKVADFYNVDDTHLRISKYDGTNTGTLTLQSNGNVGIGTTSPTDILSVGLATNALGGVLVGEGSTKVATLGDASSIGTNGLLELYAAGTKTVQLHALSSQVSYINAGNVGIGTTDPQAKIDVSNASGSNAIFRMTNDGSATAPFDPNYYTIRLINEYSGSTPAANQKPAKIGFRTVTSNGWGAEGAIMLLASGTSSGQGDLVFTTGAASGTDYTTERMRIMGNGNVGIGTTAPAYTLDVNGAINATSVLVNGVAVGSQWTTNGSNIYYSGGNVGIGTTAPGAKLDVGTGGLRVSAAGSDTYASGGYIQLSNTASAQAALQMNASGNLGFWTDNGGLGWVQKMVLTNGGNVGIGTVAPGGYRTAIRGSGDTSATGALWVSGATAVTPGLMVRDDGNVGIGITTPVDTLQVNGGISLGGDTLAGNRTRLYEGNGLHLDSGVNTRPILFEIDSAEKMRIDTSGNVGIGTTGPTEKLTVSGNVQLSGQLAVGVQSVSGLQFINNGTIGTIDALPLMFRTGSAEQMRITTTGNVGIGTASPGYPLEVVGRIAASSAITTKTRLVENGGFTPDTTYYVKVFTSSGTVEKVSFKMTSSTGSEYGAEVEAFIPAYSSFAGYGTNAMPQISTRVDGLKSQTPTFKNILYTSPSNGVTELWLEFYVDSYATRAISLSENPGSEPVTWAGRTTTPPTNILKTVAFTTAAKTENGLTTTYSGNVGIGTTAPSSLLDVNGVSRFTVFGGSDAREISLNTPGGTDGGIVMRANSSDVTTRVDISRLGGDLGFFLGSGTGERMRITSAGNVGIGTTNPGGKLEVNGGAVDTTSFGSNKVLKLSNTSVVDGSRIGIGFSNNESIGSSLAFVEAVSDTHSTGATSLRFSVYNGSTWNSDMMTLKAGNVGIGTTAPGAKLDVAGVIRTSSQIDIGMGTAATTNPALYIGQGTGANQYGTIQWNPTASVLQITPQNYGAAPGISINTSGNVGIGTTNPADILEVKANGTTSSGMIVTAGGTSASVHAFVVRDSALTQLLRVEQNGNIGIGTTDPSTNRLSIVANTSTTGLKIRAGGAGGVPMFDLADGNGNNPIFVSNDGKLGIGTTSPISKLSNNSSGIIGGYGAAGINWDITENGYLAVLRNSSTGSAAGGLYVKADNTGGAPAMYADGEVNLMAGNVGIGTTVPGVKLQLQGTTAAGTPGTEEQLKLTRSIAGSVSYPQAASFALGSYSTNNVGNSYGPDTRLDIKLKSTSVDDFATDATIMTLQDNGNVGIGTTSPGQKLDIDGYVQIRSGSRLRFPTADLTSNFADIYSPTDEGATASPLAFRVGAGEALRIQSGGNVGIGTTTPWKPLSVVGQIYTAGGSADGTANAQGVVINNTGWGSGGGLWKIVSGNTTQRLDFYANTAAASDFSTNNIPLTLLQNGNVGIGTISPGRKLFVNGDAGGTTGWYNDSDARLKKNVTTISGALEKVKNLRGVNFEWKDTTNHPTGNHIGFIAQEAMKVTPEAVDKKGEYYSMDYSSLTAVLVEAVKELASKVNYLTSRIEELFAKHFDQQQEINELKALVCLDHPTAKVCKR